MKQLAGPLFEEKVMDYILEIANVTDVETTAEALYAEAEASAARPAAKKAAKKTAKRQNLLRRKQQKKPAAKKAAEKAAKKAAAKNNFLQSAKNTAKPYRQSCLGLAIFHLIPI